MEPPALTGEPFLTALTFPDEATTTGVINALHDNVNAAINHVRRDRILHWTGKQISALTVALQAVHRRCDTRKTWRIRETEGNGARSRRLLHCVLREG